MNPDLTIPDMNGWLYDFSRDEHRLYSHGRVIFTIKEQACRERQKSPEEIYATISEKAE